ncbi:MAG: type II toxin-antitoxin system RelE/ParE family toxin [Pseudomonadota bacterium]
MRIRFLETAEIEPDEAVQYYNLKSPGLGDDFLSEVLKVLDRIATFPEAWNACSRRSRRGQTHRFPYGIIYQVLPGEILVVAIANQHREPDYWEDRI